MALNPNKDNYFDIKKFKEGLLKSVTSDYIEGGLRVSNSLNKDPIRPNSKELKRIADVIYESIQGVTEEMSKTIRREIKLSILAGETNQQLANRLDNIFKGNNPTRFRYEDRLRMIARTEKTRVLNLGSMNTAEKVGATGKYIGIVNDSRTTKVSKEMFKKYGSEDKAIPLDKEFNVIVDGKEYKGLYPPFMPNDRDYVLYTFE